MRTPTCRYGHPQIDIHETSMVAEVRADGIRFQTCRKCDPHTYAFGVMMRAHRMITFYAITLEQLRELRALSDDVDTFDILVHLGYASKAP